MAPKRTSSDAGSASELKRTCDVLSISEKVKILDMIEIEQYTLLLLYLMLVMSYCAQFIN
jgi:hypothetical protein